MTPDALKALIRAVPDHPAPGIVFRDINPLLADAAALDATICALATGGAPHRPTLVAGIEARGFIFGAAVAARLGAGFLPIRKAGKLPGKVLSRDYALEYGTDRLEILAGLIPSGARVLLIDDLIATGGTALAALALLREAGAEVAAACFVIDLPELGGSEALRGEGVAVEALMAFEGG